MPQGRLLFKPQKQFMDLINWGYWTHLVYYGGRASGKTWSTAIWALIFAMHNPGIRVMVTRQFYESLNESMFTTFRVIITHMVRARPRMRRYFAISSSKSDCWIRLSNGSEFIFYGVDRNPESLKGVENIQILIADETQTYKKIPIEMLRFTINRNPGIRCVWLGNPTHEDDAWWSSFVLPGQDPSNRSTRSVYVTYEKNEFIQDREKFKEFWNDVEDLKVRDPDYFRHIMDGEFDIVSDAIIFKRLTELQDESETQAFEASIPSDARWLYGIDWSHGGGDPHALVECAVWPDNLYIAREVVLYGPDTDIAQFPANFTSGMTEQGLANVHEQHITCDRTPILVRHLEEHGFESLAMADKPEASRLDGYRWQGAHSITISHRCPNAKREYKYLKYDIDPKTNEPRRPIKVLKKNDHTCDAVNYATRELMLGEPLAPSTVSLQPDSWTNEDFD